MKNLTPYFCLLLIFIISCKKEQSNPTATKSNLNLIGISASNKHEITNIDLASMERTAAPIDCYYMGSTLFDPTSKSFGYAGCDSLFHFVNLLSNKIVKEIPLPYGHLTQSVINSIDNKLIGISSIKDSMFILTFDLSTGEVLSQNRIDVGEGIFACSYFYDEETNNYFLVRADNVLLTINPDNGSVITSIPLAAMIQNTVYDKQNKQLIGFSYNQTLDSSYIVKLNVETGEIVRKTSIKAKYDYYGCVSAFDYQTDEFILVTAKNNILFINSASGQIRSSVQLDFALNEFVFWRNQ